MNAPPKPQSEVEQVAPPLEGFFGKRLRDGKIAILAHRDVSDEALLAARASLERALAHAPKLRKNLEARGFEVHVIGLRQFPSELPEMRGSRGTRIDSGELFDHHMVGGHLVDRFLSCTEGTLLPIVGHRLFGDETCIHELGHAIELRAMSNAARAKVLDAFERSIKTGHFENQYAAKNAHEWFAEITKYYLRADRPDLAFYDPSLAHGHDWLCRYDADACKLASDVYSGAFDPGTPRTVAIALRPGREEQTLRSARTRSPMELVIHNGSAARVQLVWIDFDGARDRRPNAATWADAGTTVSQSSWRDHTFVIADEAGKALCTLTTPEDDATADFTGPCE